MSPKKKDSFAELVRTVIYAGLIALGIRTIAYEPFNIPSGSMIPTLLIGDYLFVSKFSYGYSRYSLPFGLGSFSGRIFEDIPERGDVAVFRFPPDTTKDYIKRIVGLPGDRIQVIDGILNINGEALKVERVDDYQVDNGFGSVQRWPMYLETLPGGRRHYILEQRGDQGGGDNTQEFVVPDGHYFAMGDNRDNSNDSRMAVGFVPAENLIGRAEFLFFSTEGDAWKFWNWPFEARFSRIFSSVD